MNKKKIEGIGNFDKEWQWFPEGFGSWEWDQIKRSKAKWLGVRWEFGVYAGNWYKKNKCVS